MQIEELLMTSSKIAIIGGGISGLSLSLFLKQSGFEPVVYEANQPKVDMSGGLQVAPNGMSVLKELNLVSKVIEAGAKNIGVRFYNHTGTLLCSPVYQEPEKYGHPAVNLSRSHLQQILLEECERNHVEIQYGKRLKNIFFAETERPIAVFENHLEIPCDLIVGADGVNSEVRGCLFPNGPRPSHTGLVAFGGFIHPSLLIDKGVSIKKDMLHMTFGPIGFFGYGYSKNHDDDHRLMWWSTIPKNES